MRVLSTNSKFDHPASAQVNSFASKLTQSLVRKYRAHRTAAALSALSDDELTDIGLVRSDITTVAERVSL